MQSAAPQGLLPCTAAGETAAFSYTFARIWGKL